MLNSCSECICTCTCISFVCIWLVYDGLTKSFINGTNSDNFLKDFLKSNESKIDKVRQKKKLMIDCEVVD